MCAHSDMYGTQAQRPQGGEGKATDTEMHSAQCCTRTVPATDHGNKKREKIQQIISQ